ncbi:MAG: creatininase family protein, partial [Burkholderiaceae bacterium]
EINAGVIQAMLAQSPTTAGVLVLPALPVGDSIEHTAFPGSLSAQLETVITLWLDVGRSVARAGIRKLVIFNTHGGQRGHVDQVAVRLRTELNMMVARANAGNFGKPAGLFSDAERAHGLHGGAIETSMMLHLRPDLVRMALAINAQSSAVSMSANQYLGMERGVGIGWMAQDLHESGICGDATQATAEAGRQLVEHTAHALATLCEELAATPLSQLKS